MKTALSYLQNSYPRTQKVNYHVSFVVAVHVVVVHLVVAVHLVVVHVVVVAPVEHFFAVVPVVNV